MFHFRQMHTNSLTEPTSTLCPRRFSRDEQPVARRNFSTKRKITRNFNANLSFQHFACISPFCNTPNVRTVNSQFSSVLRDAGRRPEFNDDRESPFEREGLNRKRSNIWIHVLRVSTYEKKIRNTALSLRMISNPRTQHRH